MRTAINSNPTKYSAPKLLISPANDKKNSIKDIDLTGMRALIANNDLANANLSAEKLKNFGVMSDCISSIEEMDAELLTNDKCIYDFIVIDR